MESKNSLINPSNQLSLNDKCYSLVGPVLTRSQHLFHITYKNYSQMFSINDIMKECKKNKASVLEELVIDFSIISNRIACSLLRGLQMQYKKDSYKKSDNMFYNWTSSLSNIMGTIINETENNSAIFFNCELINKDIIVSSTFLKQINAWWLIKFSFIIYIKCFIL